MKYNKYPTQSRAAGSFNSQKALVTVAVAAGLFLTLQKCALSSSIREQRKLSKNFLDKRYGSYVDSEDREIKKMYTEKYDQADEILRAVDKVDEYITQYPELQIFVQDHGSSFEAHDFVQLASMESNLHDRNAP